MRDSQTNATIGIDVELGDSRIQVFSDKARPEMARRNLLTRALRQPFSASLNSIRQDVSCSHDSVQYVCTSKCTSFLNSAVLSIIRSWFSNMSTIYGQLRTDE
jgi:hypothetical protein